MKKKRRRRRTISKKKKKLFSYLERAALRFEDLAGALDLLHVSHGPPDRLVVVLEAQDAVLGLIFEFLSFFFRGVVSFFFFSTAF